MRILAIRTLSAYGVLFLIASNSCPSVKAQDTYTYPVASVTVTSPHFA